MEKEKNIKTQKFQPAAPEHPVDVTAFLRQLITAKYACLLLSHVFTACATEMTSDCWEEIITAVFRKAPGSLISVLLVDLLIFRGFVTGILIVLHS